ncbi:MAG TPA: SUMF1/EgtB/PvdO family nonheme iron enzyme [Blastocatellia bacterium]|nr:SUMF1/EgtB/PvdO family nonheme iron enzyme [Blastocatellia bacterium]HMY71195.1 SUMF1/EgtB/PvdO family nonheme iron enzyme [Blastocatellia bacterium]
MPPPTATENPLSKPSAPVPRAKSEERHQGHAPTVITPLLPFTRMPDDLPVSEASTKGRGWNRQVFLQVALALGVIGLICFGLARWLGGSPFSDLETLTQPTPQVLEVKPSPQSSPVTQSSPPAASAEGMIYIPGGTFQMGRNDGDEYERPTHTVTIKPFLIDRTEVTNEAYQRFVAATGHRSPTHWPDGKFPESAAKLPVVNVSWDDANAYAQWAKKRLPTEAEWEFAARGNDGRIYPWGNTWTPSATNAARSTGGKLAEVGSFPNGASPFGVLDMCGNVWEWTSGSLKSYAQGEQEIAPGKVIRGGAFDVPSARATTTYRGVLREDRLPDKTGFRTVRDAATP